MGDRRLSVIDDSPRDDFSPRQRHTLKEFAVRQLVRLLDMLDSHVDRQLL